MRTYYVLGIVAALAVGCGSSSSSSDGGGSSGKGGTGSGVGGAAGGDSLGMGGSSGTGGSSGAGGSSGTGGSSGAGGSGGNTGKPCGGIAGIQCDSLDWCDFPGDTCGAGDLQGQCQPQDHAGSDCTAAVCGCDGKSYKSACSAHDNGVDAVSTKPCIHGNGGTGAACAVDGDCTTGFKCCAIFGRLGSPIACMQIAAGNPCPAFP
jgi:hypothetical protein